MKKVLKYLPQILFAAALVFMGALGKLTGADQAVAMFTDINLFGQVEAFGRILVGLLQLFAGVGVFFKPTRKLAAIVGIVVMAGAIYYHLTLLGGSPIVAIVVLILGVWILKKGCGCCKKKGTCDTSKTCDTGTCPAEKADMSEE